MAVVIVDTFSRGSTGDSPFPIVKQEDIKIAYLTVANIIERDAIEEWKRTAGLRVHVLADGKDYRLGSDVTIAGQVWTEVQSSAAFQLIAEKNSPGGYVGLELDGFINPAYIKSIYANSSYIVATIAERNALTTVTGDIIVVTDTSETYVKLNNNPSPTIDDDFSLLSVAATVLSVNGQVGSVVIDFNSILTQGGSQASFESAVAATPSVSGNTSQTANNTSDIVNIYSILSGLGVATETAIPLYNGTTTYEDGFNVVYGATGAVNLYRVKNGQGPVTGIAPTDITKWERIGDFYTQDEIDALLLNLVSEPDFNWNRPIKKLPEIGQIPGSNKLIEGTEEIYYGRIDATAELISIEPLEIGALISPTINGRVTLGDGVNIQQITILDDVGNDVGNPSFIATNPVIEFSFQVNTPILIIEGSNLKYSIKIEVSYNPLLPNETYFSEPVAITPVYPILFGIGVADLDAGSKYTVLQKLIEIDGNKTVIINSNSNKIYYCIPEEYTNRVSIIDEGGNDLLGSLFPDAPTIEQVNSSGLNVDWAHNYKVYQANYITDSSNTALTFVVDRNVGVNSINTLDDITEGSINKHLTKSLKEKLVNWNPGDYLSKAIYDIDDNGVVEKAASLATNSKNVSGSIIPKNKLIHITGADSGTQVVLIELADSSSNKVAHGITKEDISVNGVGLIAMLGFAEDYSLPGASVTDVVYLGNLGNVSLTEPPSGLVQTIGTVLESDGTTVLLKVNPQDIEDRANFLFNWKPFTPYYKETHFIVDLSTIPSIASDAIVLARVIVDNYISTNNIVTDYNSGKFEIIGGDVKSEVIDPRDIRKDVYDMDSMDDGLTETDPAIRKVTITEDERTKLRNLEPASFKGIFANPTALRTAHDNSTGLLKDGDSANVTSTNSTWAWDSNLPPTAPTVGGDWYDTGVASGGDMVKSIFSPAKNAVLYNTDNHDTGVVNAVYPIVDRDKLAAIEPGATADQTAAEIKTAYESNPDTNVYTDAEKTKLNTVEVNAKDDQLAIEVPYDNTTSGMVSTEVQGAIDELDNTIKLEQTAVMYKSIYDANQDGIVNSANQVIEIAINGETVDMNAGDAVYIDSITTDKSAKFSSNDNPLTVPMTGIVLNDGAVTIFPPGTSIKIGIKGVFQIPSFGGFVSGNLLYLGTLGKLQNTKPVINNTTSLVLAGFISGLVSGNLIIEVFNFQVSPAADISFNDGANLLTNTNVQDALAEAGDAAKGSISNHLDVDITGIQIGDRLEWNGTNLIPYRQQEFIYNVKPTTINNTVIFIPVINTSDNFIGGDYKFEISYQWNHSVNTSDFESKITFDGVVLFDLGAGVSHKEKPKDAGGNTGGTGSAQQLSFNAGTLLTIAPGLRTLLVEFRTGTAGINSAIWDVFVTIKKIN